MRLQTIISAEDGSFSFAKVLHGSWVIREIESLKGFVLSEEEIPVTIGEVDEVVEIELENYFIKGNIKLIKVDVDYSDNHLASTKFEVFADTNGDGKFDDKDELIGELTELDGGIYQMLDLRYGQYFVHEKTTPEGFILDKEVYSVFIDEDGKTYKAENKAGVGFINIAAGWFIKNRQDIV